MVLSLCVLAIEIAEVVFDLDGFITLLLAIVKFILSCWEKLASYLGELDISLSPPIQPEWLLARAA